MSPFLDAKSVTWGQVRVALAKHMALAHPHYAPRGPNFNAEPETASFSKSLKTFSLNKTPILRKWNTSDISTLASLATYTVIREDIAPYQTGVCHCDAYAQNTLTHGLTSHIARCHWSMLNFLDVEPATVGPDNGSDDTFQQYFTSILGSVILPFAKMFVQQGNLGRDWTSDELVSVNSFVANICRIEPAPHSIQPMNKYVLGFWDRRLETFVYVGYIKFRHCSVHPMVTDVLQTAVDAEPTNLSTAWGSAGTPQEIGRAMILEVAEDLESHGCNEGLLTGVYGYQYRLKWVLKNGEGSILCTDNLASPELSRAAHSEVERTKAETYLHTLDQVFLYFVERIRRIVNERFSLNLKLSFLQRGNNAVIWIDSNQGVVLKQYFLEEVYLRELGFLLRLRDVPWVPRVLATAPILGRWGVFMTFEGGPVSELQWAETEEFVRKCVEELHGRGIHHHDIAARNLLRRGSGDFVMIDFESAMAEEECRDGPSCPDLMTIFDFGR